MPLLRCARCGFYGYGQALYCGDPKCGLVIVAIEEPHAKNPLPENQSVLYVPPKFWCNDWYNGG